MPTAPDSRQAPNRLLRASVSQEGAFHARPCCVTRIRHLSPRPYSSSHSSSVMGGEIGRNRLASAIPSRRYRATPFSMVSPFSSRRAVEGFACGIRAASRDRRREIRLRVITFVTPPPCSGIRPSICQIASNIDPSLLMVWAAETGDGAGQIPADANLSAGNSAFADDRVKRPNAGVNTTPTD